jgi:hypothetical protein
MKHLLGGVAIGAVLAITAPVWAQQAPNSPPPPATTAAPMAQPATPAVPQTRPMAPQAQAPMSQQPMATNAQPTHHRYAHGMRYQMSEHAHHWRHWRHADAGRWHHRHYAHWHRGWGPYASWTGDWAVPQLNAQQQTTYVQSGSSTAPMAYSASAGFEGPAPGSVLWYPPGTNPPSPPGFPPPFWFW